MIHLNNISIALTFKLPLVRHCIYQSHAAIAAIAPTTTDIRPPKYLETTSQTQLPIDLPCDSVKFKT